MLEFLGQLFGDVIPKPDTLAPMAVAALCGYLLGVFVFDRQKKSSPWLAMIAVVPASALVGAMVGGVFMLFFFMLTLGGEIRGAYIPLSAFSSFGIAVGFGIWARGPRDWLFRIALCFCAFVVVAYGIWSWSSLIPPT